ncbi:MAG TPA: bacteriohopanetetrol glucosamine biosynthesis glycosyltransferase HpnI [Terriglobales bacterium]|nr:bacteriohopanetetrol glucosamine biosynthesis glycosyltransferase HpnI [Terriglobales bacterium]
MIHSAIRLIQFVAIAGCISSSSYYLLCLWSAFRFLRVGEASMSARSTLSLPPVSILKPLKGTDPDIYKSFRSHCLQDYPEYEIIFGVSDPADPAVVSVRQLQQEFPQRAIRLVVCDKLLGSNVKVSNLAQMLPVVRHEYLLINDSDIQVEPDYLRRVIAPLADDKVAEGKVTDKQVGMVTCLYRGVASPTLGSHLESLGISTDFCAGVLVARQIEGGLRFGLGSTLAFRRAHLDQAGGFLPIVDFLADDYELGRRIWDLGRQVHLSDVVVETHLPPYSLREFLAHQLRWARGVRAARAGGYAGMIATFGLIWALLNLIAAHAAPWSWAVLGVVVLLRLAVAFAVGRSVLHDHQLLKHLWLLPVRDLIAVLVWIASFAGRTVTWRGDRFTLKNGRLTRIPR